MMRRNDEYTSLALKKGVGGWGESSSVQRKSVVRRLWRPFPLRAARAPTAALLALSVKSDRPEIDYFQDKDVG